MIVIGRLAAVTVNNNEAMSLAVLARDEFVKGDWANAETHIRRSIELNPRFVHAYDLLSSLLEQAGRFDESAALAREGLAVEPTSGSLYYRLARTSSVDDKGLVTEIEEVLKSGNATVPDQRYLHYALGKSYDDLSEYESAMKHWDFANELSRTIHFRGAPFDSARYEAYFDRVRSTLTADYLQRHKCLGSDSKTPILIVGMPRSGTTLVEQILSSHPDVGAAGEVHYWLANDIAHSKAEPKSFAAKAQNEYLSALSSAAPGKAQVTDKMPDNYMLLGRIHTLFPNARIVHIRRNPADNCLSIYATPYSSPPRYAYSKEAITFAYRCYLGLTEHWRTVLPPASILDIAYEDLVNDTEQSVRSMLQFLDLPWSEACLAPESNKRIVRTPSAWQVRQPIYDRSVGKWKHYAPWLGPFAGPFGP